MKKDESNLRNFNFKRLYNSASAEETIAIGQEIGNRAGPGAVICLFGDLGAGKTTLIKGIVSALTDVMPEDVCSPTFAYLAIYEGKCPVYHFDLYRLKDAEAFLSLGFEEYLFSQGVCCLEWSERVTPILPRHSLPVIITYEGLGKRKIVIEDHNEVSKS